MYPKNQALLSQQGFPLEKTAFSLVRSRIFLVPRGPIHPASHFSMEQTEDEEVEEVEEEEEEREKSFQQ